MINNVKKRTLIIRFFGSAVVLCFLVLLLQGCNAAQSGESAAEVRRRHIRNDRIARRQLMDDIDNVMLRDTPSSLSSRRIP